MKTKSTNNSKLRIQNLKLIFFCLLLSAFCLLFFSGCGGGKQSATQTTTVTTGNNSAPVISSVSASSGSVQISAQVSLTCTASDNDGDTLSYSWAVSGGSLSSATGSSTTWTAPSTTGNYTATCSVGDGKTNTSGNVSITVSPASSSNSNPTISSVTASSSSIAVGQTTTITVAASDSDGDVLGYSYSATGGTVSGTTSSATYTAPSSAGSYTVQVSVTDGKGGSAVKSVDITVTTSSSATTLLDEQFDSFSGWEYAVDSNSGATFTASNGVLSVDNFGTQAGYWYGPSVIKNLSQPLDISSQDFTASAYFVSTDDAAKSVGKIFVKFLDADNTPILQLCWGDSGVTPLGQNCDAGGSYDFQGSGAIGFYAIDKWFYSSGNNEVSVYATISGKLTIKKSSGQLTAYFNDGSALGSYTVSSAKTISKVSVQILKYGSYSARDMKIDYIKLTTP